MKLFIWSRRFSVARSWQWVREREVTADTRDEWLSIFQSDEPTIRFVVWSKEPSEAAAINRCGVN